VTSENSEVSKTSEFLVEFGRIALIFSGAGTMDLNFNWVFGVEGWIALFTLIALELVLGVDNIVFISILSGKLPQSEQPRARTTGIFAAVFTRILLLLSIKWIIGLEEPLLHIPWFGGEEIGISGHDLILLAGGIFLLWKSTHEIHEKLEGKEGAASAKIVAKFWSVVFQIMLLDIVFSLDSVITAVGMSNELAIMIIAVIVAAGVMIFVSGPIGNFVERHPTIKILALSFLLLIGFTLVVEGLHQHIPKGYVYFAMGFSVMVEMFNLRVRDSHVRPVNLRDPYKEEKLELQPVAVAVDQPVVKAAVVKPRVVKSKAAAKPAAKKASPKTKK
jgi:predicted tellurium resistance membrane protein TerC